MKRKFTIDGDTIDPQYAMLGAGGGGSRGGGGGARGITYGTNIKGLTLSNINNVGTVGSGATFWPDVSRIQRIEEMLGITHFSEHDLTNSMLKSLKESQDQVFKEFQENNPIYAKLKEIHEQYEVTKALLNGK